MEKERVLALIKEMPIETLTKPKSKELVDLRREHEKDVHRVASEFDNWRVFVSKYHDIDPALQPKLNRYVEIVNKKAMDKLKQVKSRLDADVKAKAKAKEEARKAEEEK